jgi:hypothetical protein
VLLDGGDDCEAHFVTLARYVTRDLIWVAVSVWAKVDGMMPALYPVGR